MDVKTLKVPFVRHHKERLDIKMSPKFEEMFDIVMLSERKCPNGLPINHYPIDGTVEDKDVEEFVGFVNTVIESTIETAILYSIFEGKNYSGINPIDFLDMSGKGYSETKFEEYEMVVKPEVHSLQWDERRSQRVVYIKKGEKLGTIYFAPPNRFCTTDMIAKRGYVFTYDFGEKVEIMAETNFIVVLENPEHIYLEN